MNEHPQEHIKYFWEDLPVGTVIEAGSTTIDREEMLEFARKYDPQPFHLNHEAAAKSIYGKLLASGWQTCVLTMRLMAHNFLHESSSLGSPGIEQIKWLKPVHAGDTLTLRARIVESRPMKSRPDAGLTRLRFEMFNQHGKQVLLMDGYVMFGRRKPAVPDGDQPH